MEAVALGDQVKLNRSQELAEEVLKALRLPPFFLLLVLRAPKDTEDVLLNVVVYLLVEALLGHLSRRRLNHAFVFVRVLADRALDPIVTEGDEGSSRLVIDVILFYCVEHADVAGLHKVVVVPMLDEEDAIVLFGDIVHHSLVEEHNFLYVLARQFFSLIFPLPEDHLCHRFHVVSVFHDILDLLIS